MSLLITAFHIEHGATEMYVVDATQAVGHHPEEWSRVPWTDEMRERAKPALEKKRAAQAERQKHGLAGAQSLVAGQQVVGAQASQRPVEMQHVWDGAPAVPKLVEPPADDPVKDEGKRAVDPAKADAAKK